MIISGPARPDRAGSVRASAARLLLLPLGGFALAAATLASAAETPNIKGLWLTTDYPAITAGAGQTTTVKLKLQNYNLPPERVALKVDGVPHNWHAVVLGGGNPVAAAMPGTNESVALQLRVDVPGDAAAGVHRLTVSANGRGANADLPIDVTIGEGLPPKLSIKTKLPSLRGSARSAFEFSFTVENQSGKDEVVKLDAQAPGGFQTSFTEAYGSQELSSVPIEAGQSKDLKLKVQPPENAGANDYPVMIAAAAE